MIVLFSVWLLLILSVLLSGVSLWSISQLNIKIQNSEKVSLAKSYETAFRIFITQGTHFFFIHGQT